MEPAAGDPVLLSSEGCESNTAATVFKIVQAELAPRSVTLATQTHGTGTASTASATAHLQCAETGAVLVVTDPQAPEPLRLQLDLSHTPQSARARLMGLELSELVATSRMERPAQAPESETRAEASTGAETTTATDPRGVIPWLGAGLAWEGSPGALAPVILAGVLGDLGLFGPLGFVADIRLEWQQQSFSDVSVRALCLSAALGPALVLRRPVWDGFVGFGLRVGHVSISGEPVPATNPGTGPGGVDGLWLGPTLSTGIHLALWGPLALRAALDLTYVSKPVRGLDEDGQALYAWDGLVGSLMLGLALHP